MLLATFTFEIVNVSLQVGDAVYYVPTNTQGSTLNSFDEGFIPNVQFLGNVFSMEPNANDVNLTDIGVLYDDQPPASISPPAIGDFLMFCKDKKVNTSSLVGYYADVKFSNNDNEKIELFSVGSEIFESSK